MALAPSEAVARAQTYRHAIVSWVDDDGYPMSVAGSFTAEPERALVEVGPFEATATPPSGRELCVTFSHIRPQPGVGYDERRYVNLWGIAEVGGGRVRVTATRATGWDESELPFMEYAERGVPKAHEYFDAVGGRPRLSAWWKLFLATRLPFLTATIVPIALGGVIAAYHGRFDLGWWLLALLAGCAVHVGLNVANDLFDDLSGADAANTTPTPFSGGSRVLQYGLVSRNQMLTLCVGAYGLAITLGFVLAAARGWELLWIGAAGIMLSLVYSMPPFNLVARGLGEPVTAAGFGPVMALGGYFVCAQRFSWEVVYASLPVAILIALVLYVNEIPDRRGDAASGKRTLPVRWPAKRVVTAYAVAIVTAFALVLAGVVTGILPAWALLTLLAAPLGLRTYRGIRDHYDEPYALMPVMQANIGLHLVAGLLLVLGYLLANSFD